CWRSCGQAAIRRSSWWRWKAYLIRLQRRRQPRLRRRRNPEQIMSDIDLEQKPSRRLWLFAGVAAVGLHLGGAALAVAHLKDLDDDDSLGAPAIEIGMELASTKSEETDLPPGPESDASVASPALAEQKAEVKETDLPKDIPTDEADADR